MSEDELIQNLPLVSQEVIAQADGYQKAILRTLGKQNQDFAEFREDMAEKHGQNIGRLGNLETGVKEVRAEIGVVRDSSTKTEAKAEQSRASIVTLFESLNKMTSAGAFNAGMLMGIKKVSTWLWGGAIGLFTFIVDHFQSILNFLHHG